MIICHFSDWHEREYKLPFADVYVCTGDMYPNFPFKNSNGTIEVVPERERDLQLLWASGKDYRHNLENKEAPVILVKGNHDFLNLSLLFSGVVYEFNEIPKTISINNISFSGVTGIPYINGNWADELNSDQEQIFDTIPNSDIILTHCPPKSIMDNGHGSGILASYLNKRSYTTPVKAHLFGHIHECKDMRVIGDIIFSNASNGYNILEI